MDVDPWYKGLADAAKAQGFVVEQQITEVVGTCPQCTSAAIDSGDGDES